MKHSEICFIALLGKIYGIYHDFSEDGACGTEQHVLVYIDDTTQHGTVRYWVTSEYSTTIYCFY